LGIPAFAVLASVFFITTSSWIEMNAGIRRQAMRDAIETDRPATLHDFVLLRCASAGLSPALF
jgi:hypothetical protein